MSQLDFLPEMQLHSELEQDERYTTRTTMALCKSLAGVAVWDLDAAACEASHWAPWWYSKHEDGLKQPWFGRTWVNPPFSGLEPWLKKAWSEMRRLQGPALIAMLLPANRTEQPFWQEQVEPFRDGREDDAVLLRTHQLPGRIQFGNPGNPEGRDIKGTPQFGCVLLVWEIAR